MNANVLEIPLISRRVHDALALADRDPSHPGQLLLDIIQTVPRSELFALNAQQLHDMARAVIDLLPFAVARNQSPRTEKLQGRRTATSRSVSWLV